MKNLRICLQPLLKTVFPYCYAKLKQASTFFLLPTTQTVSPFSIVIEDVGRKKLLSALFSTPTRRTLNLSLIEVIFAWCPTNEDFSFNVNWNSFISICSLLSASCTRTCSFAAIAENDFICSSEPRRIRESSG